MRRKTIFATSLLILVVTVSLFISNSALLYEPVLKEPFFPVGTLVAWMGIITLPTSIYYGIEKLSMPGSRISKTFSNLLKFIIFLCWLWGPLGYLLGGTFSFIFEDEEAFPGGILAAEYFWIFTFIVVLLPLVFLLTYLLYRLLNKIFRDRRLY
ncbi:MAG: hypothetical protein WAM00_08970 [Salegentibacter sp.]